jgi:hypothetical protein
MAPPPQDRRLRTHTQPPPEIPWGHEAPRWWWLGCHGGAGVSTLSALIPGGWDANRAFPDPRLGGPAGVLLVCRTNAAGLNAAQNAVRQAAAGYAPRNLALWGLVIVADAPGRLPRPLNAQIKRLGGTVQRLFTVPWVEPWRTETPSAANAPAAIAAIGRELRSGPWLNQNRK